MSNTLLELGVEVKMNYVCYHIIRIVDVKYTSA